jgi:hypothetical protein
MPSRTRSAPWSGRRYAITSTWPPSWRAAATPKRTWSASPKNTIRGFDPSWFAEALNAVDRLPDALFAPYGLDPQDVPALKAQMHAWAEKISRD